MPLTKNEASPDSESERHHPENHRIEGLTPSRYDLRHACGRTVSLPAFDAYA